MKAFDLMYDRLMSSEERKETNVNLSVLSNLLCNGDVMIDYFSDRMYWESLSQ